MSFDPNVVLNQLTHAERGGAGRLTAMIGAKNFARGADEDGEYVSFRFPMKAKNKSNYIKVKLNSLDLYNVEFGYIRANKYTVRSEVSDLYCDQLKEYFEGETSLYLSL